MDTKSFEEQVAKVVEIVKSTTGEQARVSVSCEINSFGVMAWCASVEIHKDERVLRADRWEPSVELALLSLAHVVNSFPFRMKLLTGPKGAKG